MAIQPSNPPYCNSVCLSPRMMALRQSLARRGFCANDHVFRRRGILPVPMSLTLTRLAESSALLIRTALTTAVAARITNDTPRISSAARGNMNLTRIRRQISPNPITSSALHRAWRGTRFPVSIREICRHWRLRNRLQREVGHPALRRRNPN